MPPAQFIEVIEGTTGAAATITLPAAPRKIHVITSLRISRTCTTAITGTAVLTITSTNLQDAGGTTATWSTGNACAVGALIVDVNCSYPDGLRAAIANTATTIVMPAPGTAGFWSGQATYYLEDAPI